jgi:hypothetical protein
MKNMLETKELYPIVWREWQREFFNQRRANFCRIYPSSLTQLTTANPGIFEQEKRRCLGGLPG